jgi:hypothetical protein
MDNKENKGFDGISNALPIYEQVHQNVRVILDVFNGIIKQHSDKSTNIFI